mgnify:CR=1 FL=1
MTNSIGEIEDADVLFIIGSNATEAHPIIGNKMKRAVKYNGTKLIVIDPRRTELAAMADVWLPLNSGSDVALINGLMKIIIDEDIVDHEYIEERVEGFDELKKVVSKYDKEMVEKITGIEYEKLIEVAHIYTSSKKAGIFYTLGITEHTTGTENVMTLSNLALITGHVGFESAGVNPIRGQNNVQGACDMAALPNNFPGYANSYDEDTIQKYEKIWNAKLSRNKGYRIPEMFANAHAGNLKAMYIMGEDPVLTDPNANHVKESLENLDFLVVQDIFMTPTAQFADIILPATCYAEKDGTFTNTERRVQRVRKAVEAPGQARLDWKIISDIAKEMGVNGFDFKNSEEVFEDIRKSAASYAGMTYERMDAKGLQWPCPTEKHPGTKYLHKGIFARGMGRLVPAEYKAPGELTCEEYPIVLSTGRMLYHYNVMTRKSDTLNDIRPCELAEINPITAMEYGLEEHDVIEVTSKRGKIWTRVTITDRVKPNMLWMTFHYWESPVNEVTNDAYDPMTMTAEYKVAAVNIKKSDHEPDNLRLPDYLDDKEVVTE